MWLRATMYFDYDWFNMFQWHSMIFNDITRFDLIAPIFKQLHLVKKVSEDNMFTSVTLGFSHRRSQLKCMSYAVDWSMST